MAWGMVGLGAASAGLGVLGQVNASNLSYNKARKLAEYQALLNYQYNTRWAKESPSLTREGLETAGYNPMLAVQNGTSGSNATSFTSGATANDVDLSTPIQNGFDNIIASKNLENQTAMTDSNIKLNQAQGRKAIADAIGQELKNPFISRKEEAELGRIGAETDKLIRETSFYDQLAENMIAERKLQLMGINVDSINAGTNAYNAETNRRQVELNEKWTPQKIMSGIGLGLIGGAATFYGPAKFKALKALGKIRPIGFR